MTILPDYAAFPISTAMERSAGDGPAAATALARIAAVEELKSLKPGRIRRRAERSLVYIRTPVQNSIACCKHTCSGSDTMRRVAGLPQ